MITSPALITELLDRPHSVYESVSTGRPSTGKTSDRPTSKLSRPLTTDQCKRLLLIYALVQGCKLDLFSGGCGGTTQRGPNGRRPIPEGLRQVEFLERGWRAPFSPARGRGERCKLPSGVRGEAPAEIDMQCPGQWSILKI